MIFDTLKSDSSHDPIASIARPSSSNNQTQALHGDVYLPYALERKYPHADRVDRELVSKPRRMDIKFIRNFMVVFGLLSSVFDYWKFGASSLCFYSQVPHVDRLG